MLAAWDSPPETPPTAGVAEIHASTSRPPRGGLAIGHSVLPDGAARFELRVTAAAGPLHDKARGMQRRARADGFDALLRVVSRPVVGLFNDPASSLPLLGGRRVPLHLGIALAHERAAGPGSLGAFVRLPDGSDGILSCSHVLARPREGRPEPGDPIQQPGLPGILPPLHRVANLSDRFAPFARGGVGNLDAAVARLRDGVQHAGNQLPFLDCIPEGLRGRALGKPISADDLPFGTPVVKLGHRTGFTRAILTAVDIENVRMQVGHRERDVFTLGPMHEVSWTADDQTWSKPGDSGALVCTEDGLRPIGLHACAMISADGHVGYVVPLPAIVDAFAIELL